MSQAPSPLTASSTQTPPAATTTPPRTTPAPRGIAESPSTISSAAESPSCFSQIGSITHELTAPASTPAVILSAQADRFFNGINSLNIPQHAPQKVALLINVDGRSVALFTQDLPAISANTNPLRAFCFKGMKGLGEILRQTSSLTPQSNVKLSMAVIMRHEEPQSTYEGTLANYRLLTTTLTATDDISSSNLSDDHAKSITVNQAAQICAGRMFGQRTSDENPLSEAFIRFIANRAIRNGWTCD